MNELNRLQRKLIPVNIVIAVLALVAAITLIFAPLLTVDVGKMAPEIVSMAAGDSGSESDGDDSENAMMKSVLSIVGDLKLSVSTFTLAQFAFSDDPIEFVSQVAADKIEEMQDDIFSKVMTEILPAMIAESEMDIDTTKIDADKIMAKFDAVTKATTDAQVEQAISALVDEVQGMVVDSSGEIIIPDDAKEDICKMVREAYDSAKEELGDEDITLESFICVIVSKILFASDSDGEDTGAVAMSAIAAAAESSSGSNGGSGEIYTNYKDLFTALFGLGNSPEGGSPDGTEEVVDIREMLEPAILIMQIVVYAMFFFAGIWFIQFLFALLHIFLKNKRVSMWYTKLFGFWPCLIFGVLPLVAGLVLPMVLPAEAGEAAGMIGVVLGAISSLTWISGACWLALWIISWFWAGPIKRKIRKELKAGATY